MLRAPSPKRFLRWCRSHPHMMIFVFFCACIVTALVTMIFVIDLAGPTTENAVYLDARAKNASGIVLVGYANTIDPAGRSMTVQWYPSGCGSLWTPNDGVLSWSFFEAGRRGPDGKEFCGTPNVPVSIFVDNNPEPAWTFDPGEFPEDPNTHSKIPYDISTRGFSTTGSMIQYPLTLPPTTHDVGLDFLYPFVYYGTAFAFTAIQGTNITNDTTFIPILQVALVAATDNYVPSRASVLNSNADFFFGATMTINGTKATSTVAQPTVTFSALARTFSLIMFFVNWGLTLVVLFMTIRQAISNEEVNKDVLVMPVTIILIIPSLRQLFVGNPPFGNIFDVLGLFPQMIIVALCAFVLLMVLTIKVKPEPEIPHSLTELGLEKNA